MSKKSGHIADFDSTTSAFMSLANFLNNKGTDSGGVVPDIPEFAAVMINAIPAKIRRAIYKWSGWYDAFPPDQLKDINEEKLSGWVLSRYPQKRYPAMMIGSANGASSYLCSAMHIPYLPQTFLLPVRRKLPPDNLYDDIEWGRVHAAPLLKNNPNLQLNQMHDPLQDRLMVERMAYVRIKKKLPGEAYMNFIRSNLHDGGTIFSLECTLKWPMVTVSDRHYFQSGGLGALEPGALSEHTPEMEKFLKKENAPELKLNIPETDTEMPEAEWGFLPEMLGGLKVIIKEKNLQLIRIIFEKPDDISPLVADLYRWWYRKRGTDSRKLIAECFALIDPWRTQRKKLVPYWLAFNTTPSAEAFNDYLVNTEPYDEVYIKLMSNGIKSIGITPIHKWMSIAVKAKNRYSLLGLDPRKYPLDLGSYGRFHSELDKLVPEDTPLPEPMIIEEFTEFVRESDGKYKVQIVNKN